MSTNDPTEHRRRLHQLKEDGKTEMWRAAISTWLDPGLEAKFRQNPAALDFLMSTGDLQIGEASTDRFWGIGMDLNHPNLLNTKHWTGENTLGKALMKLRNKIADHS